MEGEFTKEQIDEFKEAFTVFDKGTSIYYVGIIFDFYWPAHSTERQQNCPLIRPTQPKLGN